MDFNKSKILAIIFITFYYYFLFISLYYQKIHLGFIYLTITIGFISFLLIQYLSRLMVLKNSFFMILKSFFIYTYGIQVNYLISRRHRNDYFQTVNILILVFFILDLVRVYFCNSLKDNFISSYRLKWYKDIIILERIFIFIKTNMDIKDDNEVIEYIQHNTKRLDPKFFFCVFSDDPENKILSHKFNILNIIDYNIKVNRQLPILEDECNKEVLTSKKLLADFESKNEGLITENMIDIKNTKNDLINTDINEDRYDSKYNIKANEDRYDSKYDIKANEDNDSKYDIKANENSNIYDIKGNENYVKGNENTNYLKANENYVKGNENSNIYDMNYKKIQEDLTGISDLKTKDMNKSQNDVYENINLYEKNRDEDDMRKYILLNYLTQYDLNCLTEKNNFIKIYKSEKNECLKVEVDDYTKLKKIDKLRLNGVITLKSLENVLPKNDAKLCFRILTQNFENFLTYTDFEESMRQLNNFRADLINTLKNNKRTMNLLFRTLLCVQMFIFGIVVLYVIKADKFIKHILTPIFILLFPIAWNLFNSFMFIIYSHLYDIGDRIYIGDDNLIVKDIGLTSTIFERWNNENVVITNGYIKERAITNIRRSRNQQWKVTFNILNDHQKKTLDQFKKNIKHFVTDNIAFKHVSINFDEIRDSRYLKMSIIITHSINHQNGFFMWKVQNKFMLKLVKELNDNNIKYLEPELTWICEGKTFDAIF